MSATLEAAHDAVLLVAIARAGTLAEASRALGVSPATVTRSLARAEKRLGVVLVKRTTRSLRLTREGAALVRRSESGLQEIAAAFEGLREEASTVSGAVRITAPPNLGTFLLPTVTRFRQAYPAVRCELSLTERKLAFFDDDVDLLLRVGAVGDDRLVARPIATYRHVLCAAPSYCPGALPKRPAELTRHPLVAFSGGEVQPWVLERGATRHSVAVTPWLSSNDYGVLLSAVEQGHGIGEAPAPLVAEALRTKRLAQVLPGWSMPEVTLQLLYPARRFLTRALGAFVDHALVDLPKAFACAASS